MWDNKCGTTKEVAFVKTLFKPILSQKMLLSHENFQLEWGTGLYITMDH